MTLTAQCLQTGNGNGLPDFVSSHGKYRIFQHHQAIIYTYRFNCCGIITEWGADVSPGEKHRRYIIDFQVWRPSPSIFTGTGCYNLVGNNSFTQISISKGLARATPSPQHHVQFQPGDVLGFYMESDEDDDPGIVLDPRSGNGELVQYASVEPDEATQVGCPYPWPSDSTELSVTLTHAAPIITICTSKLIDCERLLFSISLLYNNNIIGYFQGHILVL